jgi:hypothetical protein
MEVPMSLMPRIALPILLSVFLLAPVTAQARKALLVVNRAPTCAAGALTVADARLEEILGELYGKENVETQDDHCVLAPAFGATAEVIVVSRSVDPAVIGTRLAKAAKPVMLMEEALLPGMGMVPAGAFGSVAKQDKVTVLDSDHLMSSRLVDTKKLHTKPQTMGWGTPSSKDAQIVSVLADGNKAHVVQFAFDAGAAMVNTKAPARRVFFGIDAADDEVSRTGELTSMMSESVKWADKGWTPPSTWAEVEGITWDGAPSNVKEFVLKKADGCDAVSASWGADGHLYSGWGDANGFSGKLKPKRSMGFGRVEGTPKLGADGKILPDSISLVDIETGTGGDNDVDGDGLDSIGDQGLGRKPASSLIIGDTLYIWLRNISLVEEDRTAQFSQLKMSKNYRDKNPTFSWAPWKFTEFGFMAFVQYGKANAGADPHGKGRYVYMVTPDGPNPYINYDRYVLLRAPKDQLLKRESYEVYTGKIQSPWSKDLTQRASSLDQPSASATTRNAAAT